MKNRMVVSLTISGLLALVGGCGKTENAPTPATEANKPTSTPEAAPSRAPEKAAAQTTNAAGAANATPVKEAAPGMVDATKLAAQATNAVAANTNVAKVPEATTAPAAMPQAPVSPTQTAAAVLSQDQVVQGLKDALAKGLQGAIASLGHDGGFLTNLNVKIPMPEKLQSVEKAARAMNEQKLADDFVVTMNHAAELAVPEAGSVFADAIKQMSIDDAKAILNGPNDAATQYFQKTTQTNLYAKFYPIVQKATQQAGVTSAYKSLMEKANVTQGLGSFGSALGSTLLGKDTLDIDAYVTNKALDGLFKMVAAEELQIRQNPVARTTDTLQKVFGSLKK